MNHILDSSLLRRLRSLIKYNTVTHPRVIVLSAIISGLTFVLPFGTVFLLSPKIRQFLQFLNRIQKTAVIAFESFSGKISLYF